jgi:hypothetical protein
MSVTGKCRKLFLNIYTHTPYWMATGTAESLAKTMASPVYACLHTKQITVIICIEEEIDGETYGSKFEQVYGTVCFTAMAGNETECTSLKTRLCDYLSKQGSDAMYEEIETYVDKWDIGNVKSESELHKLEMLIEEMKLDVNCYYAIFWKWMMCEHWIVYWGKMCS